MTQPNFITILTMVFKQIITLALSAFSKDIFMVICQRLTVKLSKKISFIFGVGGKNQPTNASILGSLSALNMWTDCIKKEMQTFCG